MRDVDAEYYGYRDEDDGVLLPLEAQHEKQGSAAAGRPSGTPVRLSPVCCRGEAVAEAVQKWRTEESRRAGEAPPQQQQQEEEEPSIYSVHLEVGRVTVPVRLSP